MSDGTLIHASHVDSECLWRDEQYRAGAWLRPPWSPFLRGTAVHGARHNAFLSYLASKTLPSLEELKRAAIGAVESRVEEDDAKGNVTPEDDVTAALDAALPIVEADYLLALPELAPHVVAVEENLKAPIGDTGHTLTGTLDTRGKDPLSGAGSILDLKTAEKSPAGAQAAADLSVQLSMYGILHRHHFGTIPTYALDYLWTMRKGPKAETVERDGLKVAPLSATYTDAAGKVKPLLGVRRRVTTTRSADDLASALLRLRFRIDAETAGWHPPAFSGFMGPCQRCPHYANQDPAQRCPFVPNVRQERNGHDEEE